MITTIISHDTETAIAVIRFEHNDVTYQDTFDLGRVVPGTRKVFEDLKMPFAPQHQQAVIEHLTKVIQRNIEEGAITNPPAEIEKGD